jgi:DNA-binding NarL/FixJ family response regulator
LRKSPSIVLVDDHEVVRQGIRQLVNSMRPDWTISGEAGNGMDAIAAVTQLQPDVLVLDVSMPGISGIETARRIRGLNLKPHIVIFTMHDSEEIRTEARNAGAEACVCKSEAGRDLMVAIESVLAGGTFFPSKDRQKSGGKL